MKNQSHDARINAKPGDVVRLFVKTEMGIRDIAFDVNEDGMLDEWASGMLLDDSRTPEFVEGITCSELTEDKP